MLSARYVDNNVPVDDIVKPSNKTKSNNIKLKNTTNIRKGLGLSISNKNIINNTKPKPLQISTNTIHATQASTKIPVLKKSGQNKQNDDSTLKKKKAQTPKLSKQQEGQQKSDENDVYPFVNDPPLELYKFDEELYQKVLKLELADDGLPSCDSSEPFDF